MAGCDGGATCTIVEPELEPEPETFVDSKFDKRNGNEDSESGESCKT